MYLTIVNYDLTRTKLRRAVLTRVVLFRFHAIRFTLGTNKHHIFRMISRMNLTQLKFIDLRSHRTITYKTCSFQLTDL